MANLIITIISIALVAVAALMGAYYGGAAFLEGSAKAKANAIINQGQQIAAAWIAYAAYNGGNQALASDGASQATAFTTLIPQYLQAQPTNNFAPASPLFSGWRFLYAMDDSGGGITYDGIANSIIAEVESEQVCLIIHKLSAGSAATLTDILGSTGDGFGEGGADLTPSNGKFDCFYYESDPAYIFLYKAF